MASQVPIFFGFSTWCKCFARDIGFKWRLVLERPLLGVEHEKEMLFFSSTFGDEALLLDGFLRDMDSRNHAINDYQSQSFMGEKTKPSNPSLKPETKKSWLQKWCELSWGGERVLCWLFLKNKIDKINNSLDVQDNWRFFVIFTPSSCSLNRREGTLSCSFSWSEKTMIVHVNHYYNPHQKLSVANMTQLLLKFFCVLLAYTF